MAIQQLIKEKDGNVVSVIQRPQDIEDAAKAANSGKPQPKPTPPIPCELSFTFHPEEWRRAKHIITTNSKLYAPPAEGQKMPTVKLPPEERRISRWFTLADVFGNGPPGKIKELSWFYDLTKWIEYGKFLGSEHSKRIKRPSKLTMYKRGTGGILNDR